jgi:hypothetical protein
VAQVNAHTLLLKWLQQNTRGIHWLPIINLWCACVRTRVCVYITCVFSPQIFKFFMSCRHNRKRIIFITAYHHPDTVLFWNVIVLLLYWYNFKDRQINVRGIVVVMFSEWRYLDITWNLVLGIIKNVYMKSMPCVDQYHFVLGLHMKPKNSVFHLWYICNRFGKWWKNSL